MRRRRVRADAFRVARATGSADLPQSLGKTGRMTSGSDPVRSHPTIPPCEPGEALRWTPVAGGPVLKVPTSELVGPRPLAELDEPVERELLLPLPSEAMVIATMNPLPADRTRHQPKVRLNLSAPTRAVEELEDP